MFPSFVIYNFALSSRIITLKHVTFDGNELPLPYLEDLGSNPGLVTISYLNIVMLLSYIMIS